MPTLSVHVCVLHDIVGCTRVHACMHAYHNNNIIMGVMVCVYNYRLMFITLHTHAQQGIKQSVPSVRLNVYQHKNRHVYIHSILLSIGPWHATFVIMTVHKSLLYTTHFTIEHV